MNKWAIEVGDGGMFSRLGKCYYTHLKLGNQFQMRGGGYNLNTFIYLNIYVGKIVAPPVKSMLQDSRCEASLQPILSPL